MIEMELLTPAGRPTLS